MKSNAEVNVKPDELDPVPTEILASAIVRIGDAASKLLNSGLSRRGLVVLLHAQCGGHRGPVSMQNIEKILDALTSLKQTYVTEKAAKKSRK